MTKVIDLMALSANGENPDGRLLAAKVESASRGAAAAPPAGAGRPRTPGLDRGYLINEQVHTQGGMTPLLFAARQGYTDVAVALLDAGVDVNQKKGGDRVSALLTATVNGHFDLGGLLLDRGADPNLAAENGVAPLYAAINLMWAPRAGYPQPRAQLNQRLSYLDYMKKLLDKGADPNARVNKKVWYSNYNFDQSGVEEIGSTAFWRAAYAADVEAMKLLIAYGADPLIPTDQAARARRVRRRRPARDRRRVGRAAGAGGRPGHPDPAGLDRRRLRRGLRRQLASLRARRPAGRGEVPGRGRWRRRQRPRPRGQLGAAPRRRHAATSRC